MGSTEMKMAMLVAVAALVFTVDGSFAQTTNGVEKGSLVAPVTAGSLGSGKPAAGSMSSGKPSAGSLTMGKPSAGSLSSGKPAAGSMASGVVAGSIAPAVGQRTVGPPANVVAARAADDGTSYTRKPRVRRVKRY